MSLLYIIYEYKTMKHIKKQHPIEVIEVGVDYIKKLKKTDPELYTEIEKVYWEEVRRREKWNA